MWKRNDIDIFGDFVKDYRSGKMSVLVGAGFSMNVSDKYQSWAGLMRDAYKFVYEDDIATYRNNLGSIYKSPKDANELNDCVDRYIESRVKKEDLLLLVSKYIKKKGYREAIDTYIENRMPYAEKSERNEIVLKYLNKNRFETVENCKFSAHESLLRCNKFLNIYTTNYDNLLEFIAGEMKESSCFNCEPIVEAVKLSSSINRRNIIKIHGSLQKVEKLKNKEKTKRHEDFFFDDDRNIRYIISQDDYDLYMKKHEAFSYLMRVAMLAGTFCLVGFSGSDPNYINWVNWMKDIICKDSESDETKVYLLSLDAPKNDDDDDVNYGVELFNNNHRVEILHLYDKEVLKRIIKCDWKKNDESNYSGDPSKRKVLTAFFNYLSRLSYPKYNEKEMESEDPNVHYALGVLYYQCENPNFPRAINHFKKAVDLGCEKSNQKLAECYFYYTNESNEDEKEVRKENINKAVELCDKKGVDNNGELLFDIGLNYLLGIDVEKDEHRARELFEKSAGRGCADALYQLGLCYENKVGVDVDKKLAVEYYEKAGKKGHADALNRLGQCYKEGVVVSKDIEKACRFFEKAAEQGHAEAQNNLGLIYQYGEGVYDDKESAVRWYGKAAVQEYAPALCNLGVCYECGEGVSKDLKDAVSCYRKAASLKEPRALYQLGYCYEKGIGVNEDKEEAIKWYRKAASLKEPRALYQLGYCYEKGIGVNEDKEEAIKWYRKAARQGNVRAEKALARLG